MTKTLDAITVGEIYIDHVFSGLTHWPAPGEEIFTPNYLCELGGGAAITACGLALLGRRVAVLGVVGAQDIPFIERRLRHFQVAPEGLQHVDTATGVTVSVSVTEERTFYSYIGANAHLAEFLLLPGTIAHMRQATHVHFAVPIPRHVAAAVFPQLRAAGCTVSLDVGWQPVWYQHPENLETCREVDFFLPNHKEAQFLTGQHHPEEVLLGLEQLGFTHVVVKLGAEGAAIHTEGAMLQVPSPKVEVVDTTGAGDAFDAGLIDAILDRCPPIDLLRRAAACGSLSTRRPGALLGLATPADLRSVLNPSPELTHHVQP